MHISFTQFMIKPDINNIQRSSIGFKKKIQNILPNIGKFVKKIIELFQKSS